MPRHKTNENTMIDYSVSLYANPANKEEAPKAYARLQVREVLTLTDFSNHISDHNGVFSRGTVKGVISDMCECLVEQLLNGNKIQLGELGTFGLSISSKGAKSKEEFSASNIKSLNVTFTPGSDFDNLLENATFNCVATRDAQAKTLAAQKANQTTVDLSKGE